MSTNLIGISGYAQTGKDTVATIIQYLTSPCSKEGDSRYRTFQEFKNHGGGSNPRNFDFHYQTEWEVKKFATKLKEIVALLIGCEVSDLENAKFKETPIGPDWVVYRTIGGSRVISVEDYKKVEKVHKALFIREELTPRTLLRIIGTECGRQLVHPDLWVRALFADYKLQTVRVDVPQRALGYLDFQEFPKWIISDMRFPNELETIKSKAGISIRVNRRLYEHTWTDEELFILLVGAGYSFSGVEDNAFSEMAINEGYHWDAQQEVWYQNEKQQSQHESEISLDGAEFDFVIENNLSLNNLIEEVRFILIKTKIL